MIGFLMGAARDQADALYSELSDAYQTALSRGVDRMFPQQVEDAGAKIKLAAKSFRMSDENAILSTVRSFHDELMPKIRQWTAAEEIAYPTSLPPAPQLTQTYKTGAGDVLIEVPSPGGALPSKPTVTPDGKQPWYLTGGIDWRIIGGVTAGLLALTFFLKRGKK